MVGAGKWVVPVAGKAEVEIASDALRALLAVGVGMEDAVSALVADGASKASLLESIRITMGGDPSIIERDPMGCFNALRSCDAIRSDLVASGFHPHSDIMCRSLGMPKDWEWMELPFRHPYLSHAGLHETMIGTPVMGEAALRRSVRDMPNAVIASSMNLGVRILTEEGLDLFMEARFAVGMTLTVVAPMEMVGEVANRVMVDTPETRRAFRNVPSGVRHWFV